MTDTLRDLQKIGLRIALATLLAAAPLTLVAAQVVQLPAPAPAAPPPVEAVPDVQSPPPVSQFPDDFGVFRSSRSAVRVGQDFTLTAGDTVRDAVVVFGNASIAGEVEGDLYVILGELRLAGSAVVRGDVVAVGGNVAAQQGVTIMSDFAVIGGIFNAPPGFTTGGEQVVVGGGLLGGWLQGVIEYLTRGLLWGRLIVPDLPWVWGALALFFLLYLAVNLLFDGPVRACTAPLAVKPLTSFGAGLLVLLLVGPVCLLLAVSIVGIAIVPFVFFALLGGWIVGKVAVARWIGMSVIGEDDSDSRAQAARSVVIGFVLISIAYMVPVVGIATWAMVGVLGLGSATLAFMSAYRRENPKPIQPADFPPPPPIPATYAGTEESGPAPAPAPSASLGITTPPPAMAYEAVAGPASAEAAAGRSGGAAAAAIPLGTPHPSVLASMPKALFRDRVAAFVLDIVLLAIIINILRADPDEMFAPILLAYHIAFWTWRQTTVGGLICQLRVVRTDGAPLTFADALIRGLAGVFSLVVFFIGVLWILRDPDSQAWHDKIAGTYVVKVPRNLPL
jgi:uncharacterized RDD family membrane protein YckC